MMTYLITAGLILAFMLGGLLVNRVYRSFATRNPHLGPFRDPDHRGCGNCGGGDGCSGSGHCDSH